MKLKVAFIGFRHGHIQSLYHLLEARGDVEITGACEEDEATREQLREGGLTISHENYAQMLADVPCDVIACGEYYALRGARIIQALEAGKHVMGDKPLCTRLEEVDRIEALVEEKDLRVGCMLELRDFAPYRSMRELIRSGICGEVHTVSFSGQHPLMRSARPDWYFEEGKHGGTINDIAIHAVDTIPWLCGANIAEVTAARAWNARVPEAPFFQDAAQLMLKLDNGGGVIGDVSYLNPDSFTYSLPQYWRMGVHGEKAYLETACNATTVQVFRDGDPRRNVPVGEGRPGGYWDDFQLDIEGMTLPDGLNTAQVLRSSRVTLVAQQAADTGEFPCSVAG
jgi:predicted dehydrogenase